MAFGRLIFSASLLFFCIAAFADLANCPTDIHSGFNSNLDSALKISDQLVGIRASGPLFGQEAAHFDGHKRFVQEGADRVFQRVGLIAFLDGSHCTATLVGACHLLTAGHCVSRLDKNGATLENKTGPIAFLSSDGKTAAAAIDVQSGGKIGHHYAVDKGEDWAFISLDRPVGKQLGWMGVRSSSENDIVMNPPIGKFAKASVYVIAGYSADIKAGIKMSVDPQAEFIRPQGKNIAEYRGDMFFGSSGGPVFRLNQKGEPEIYAIQTDVQNSEDSMPRRTKSGRVIPVHTAHYAKNDVDHLNIALTSSAFLSRLKKFIKDHPCPEPSK